MSSASLSTSTQTTTGTFGTSAQRISVDNPGGANAGFSLSLNVVNPGVTTWTNGTNSYAYNGATPDQGQLTINPSLFTWSTLTGTTTALSKGTLATFTNTTPITLVTASSSLEDIWNGYMIGTSLSQTIPGGTPAGTYSLSMVQTVTTL